LCNKEIGVESEIRRNFPNFSFSRVLEMFVCQSSEIFQKKPRIFKLAKFLQKSLDINHNCTKKLHKDWVFEVRKSLETGFSEHSEISEIVLFQTFQKLQKNDFKLELRKSQKTRSDSKTDSKVRLKVWNAGP